MSSDGQHFVVYPKGTLDYLKAPVIIDPQGSTLAKRAFCDGVQARPLSADGRIMVVSIFSAATGPGITGLLIWNRVTDTLTRLVPTAPTTDPNKFSGDGRRIAFWSTATNLVDPPAATGHDYVKDVVQPVLTSLTPNSSARASQSR